MYFAAVIRDALARDYVAQGTSARHKATSPVL